MSAIKLNITKTDASLAGQSKWWGAPDLPAGSPYPTVPCSDGEGDDWDEPLTFLCQIRCEDIAALDTENQLPHTGMLYFFAAVDYFLGLDSPIETHIGDWDQPCVRVMYSPSCDNLEPYDLHYDSGESVFYPEEKLTFVACEDHEEGFKLLGKPYLQEVQEEHPDKISLLQVDENDDWNLRFYDCGMLNLLISEKDLKNRYWEGAQGYLFSF